MKLGSINLSKMYVGVSEVIKTYIGSTQNYSNDPYYVGNFQSPELTFDFGTDYYRTNASATTFPSAITHSRASNATMVDSDGLLKWAPHNLLTYSEDFDTGWSQVNVAASGSRVTASAGTFAAYFEQAASNRPAVQQTITVIVSETVGRHRYVWLGDRGVVPIASATFDLDDVSVIGQNAGVTPTIATLPDGSVRCTIEYSRSSVGTSEVNIALAGPSHTSDRPVLTWTGSEFIEAKVSLYRSDLGMVNNPDTNDSYVPTTTSPVYLPRRGHHVYSGSEWVNEGLLVESEARTNILPESSKFENWDVPFNVIVSDYAEISPDGAQTASIITPTAVDAEHYLQQFLTPETGTFTDSVYVKANGYNKIMLRPVHAGATEGVTTPIRFDLTTETVISAPPHASGEIQNVGNGWFKISGTFTISGTINGAYSFRIHPLSDGGSNVFLGDGVSGFLIYGAQREKAPTLSSYIPTSGAEVTRAAETLTVPSANLPYSSTAMSIQMEGKMTYADTDNSVEVSFFNWSIDAGNRITAGIATNSTKIGDPFFEQSASSVFDFVTGADDTYSPGINVPFNLSSRHGSTFINGAVDGTALTEDTTPIALPDLSTTDLDLAFDYMGTIKTFRIWNEDIGDAGIEEASS